MGVLGDIFGSDAPDMSGMNQAAMDNAQLGRETLAFYKQAYEDQAPMRARAADTAQRVSEAQISMMQANQAQADDYLNYQKGTFRPLEQGIVSDAQSYDTTARREAAAAQAASDVSRQAVARRAATARAQASMGVRPDSGRAAALDRSSEIAEAAAVAGAANTARRGVETQGYARRMDAANLGRNLASNQATSAQIASSTGNSAVSNATAPVNIAQGGVSMMGQGFGQAIGANTSAANIYGQVAGIQQQANSSNMQAVGQLTGAAAMYFSDKNLKSDVRVRPDDEALDAVEKTPVPDWKYDPAKGGPDDGGVTHTGPMAQDVRKNMGDSVAPGGKAIDAISLVGTNMKATKALARRVKELEGTVASIARGGIRTGVAA